MFHEPEKVPIDRALLYEQVWSQPMLQLAKSYGVSDVGLRKLCKRLKIPLPRAGYFLRKKKGKAGSRPALPPLDEKAAQGAFLTVRRKLPPDPEQAAEAEKKVQTERLAKNRVEMPPEGALLHPLVQKTWLAMKGNDPHHRWLIWPCEPGTLDIATSPNTVGRAIRVMDALIKALDRRGLSVSVIENSHPSGFFSKDRVTCAEVLGEKLEFNLEEALTMTEGELSPIETELSKRYPKVHISSGKRWTPTGRLRLQIRNLHGEGAQSRWEDGKQPLEDRLNDFIAGLFKGAVTKRAWELERDRFHAKLDEDRRQREEEARKQQEEKARIEELEGMIEGWIKSRQAKSFLRAARKFVIARDGQIEPGGKLELWFQWGEAWAEIVSPLRPALPKEQQNA